MKYQVATLKPQYCLVDNITMRFGNVVQWQLGKVCMAVADVSLPCAVAGVSDSARTWLC